jgi:hypothetical protein
MNRKRMKKSEGVKRLSLLLGTLGALGWIIFITIVTNFFTGMQHSQIEWSIIAKIVGSIIVCGISFLLPFGITKGIAWVIDGFKQDKSKL